LRRAAGRVSFFRVRAGRAGRVEVGAKAGVVVAAAAAGALLGFGLRQGTPARPFNAVAAFVLGARAEGIWGFDLAVTGAGVLALLLAALAWGVLFAVAAAALRGVRLAAAALLSASLILAGVAAVTSTGRFGQGAVIGLPQLGVILLVGAVALVVGMRLAR
jgi:hypothetical protein